MKPLTVSKKTIRKIKAWNKLTKASGIHFPFVRAKDVRSPGRRYEHYCMKQKRVVHLLSDGEYRSYIKKIWSPYVIRVNEQVPLDLTKTMELAHDADVLHPHNYRNNTANVMTTDFVVTEFNPMTGELFDCAYSFKYFSSIYKLEGNEAHRFKMRTWQKLDLEKAYWESKNIGYKIITEKDATKIEAWNIQLFLTEYYKHVDKELLIEFTQQFIELWNIFSDRSLEFLLKTTSSRLNLHLSDGITLFKHASIRRLIDVNLSHHRLALYRKVVLL